MRPKNKRWYYDLELLSIGKAINAKGHRKAHCRCRCGKLVEVFYNNLISGMSKSCGCFRSRLHKTLHREKDVVAVPLMCGGIALVSRQDVDRVMLYHWKRHARTGYAIARINGRYVRLHRFILGLVDGQLTDHANHDPLDCTRSNLRVANHSTNTANSRPTGRVGFRGVMLTASNRFKAYIGKQDGPGKYRGLGTFKSPKDAAKAYDFAAKLVYGDFAYQNFPAKSKVKS